MKSNATRFSHDLTGVMPVPEVDVTTDPVHGKYVNLSIVGYTLGSGRDDVPLNPVGGHVQVALRMHAYYAARLLTAAMERLEAAVPGITADIRLSPMEPYRLPTDEKPKRPCPDSASINIKGAHFPCTAMDGMHESCDTHEGWPHANAEAQAVWQ